MRKVVTDVEKTALHAPKMDCIRKIKAKLNQMVQEEIRIKIYQFQDQGKKEQFEKIITFENVICEKMENGEYTCKNVFPDLQE